MSTTWRFNETRTRILLDKPEARPLKITATRLASVLGLNPWQSAFSAWCEICRVYKEPFTENKYTKAGKVIEPVIIEWAKKEFDGGVVSPAEYFGNTWGEVQKQYDFYKTMKVFGGMWDAKIINVNRDTVAVIEIKTSSRPQDWEAGVPDEKVAQALMYAHLEGAKRTFVIVAFLSEEDYQHPEWFVPQVGVNLKQYGFETETATVMFDGKPTTISELMAYANEWWNAYVLSGISPEIDQKADEKILRQLRIQRPDEDETTTLGGIIGLLDEKEAELLHIREENGLDILEDEIKALKEALKRTLTEGMGEHDNKVEVGSWSLSKTERTSVDTDALKADGLYDKYAKTSVSYTLKKKGEK